MPKSDSKLLKVEKVSFSFGEIPILHEIDLELETGEIAALIGTSGSGKSTLFKLITGILEPSIGSIYINDSLRKSEHVSYMMQEDLLLPWRSVLGNLTLLAELGKTSLNIPEIEREAMEILKEVGLAEKEFLFPDQLSGGMRQRVSLARALLQKRPLLLLDEPFGSLDIHLRDQMYALLKKIHLKHKTTILLVTHDFRDALSLADSVYHLAEGQISNKWNIDPEIRGSPHVLAQLQDRMKDSLALTYLS